ncbi:hypothetical protein [Nocardioides mangrovi]|uniref:Uncharacterized protein n=1 Tax=Nocardioides mangrovi TaxID=2874580 RepID=A0ABS7UBV5_9ACTN|nr:hypothetical protein [Nocardioides mangrovi]MBZ5738320.1 hypothetical protein [Nocardioides mangrovi]
MSTGFEELVAAEVERTFAGEPPLRDPREYVARGRRARRRRRVAAGASGVAALVVTAAVGFGGARLAADADRGVSPADGVGTPVRASTTLPVERERPCAPMRSGRCGITSWLHVGADGGLARGYADVDVTGRYDDVFSDSYRASSALEVRRGERVSWVLATWSWGDGGVTLDFACADPARTFDQWVVDSARLGGLWRDYTCASKAMR